jgi:DAK2 domain fusion protein YloV
VGYEEFVKVHVHTNHPGAVLEFAIRQGSLENIKIDNMRAQHNSLINFNEETPRKEVGFVSVAAGSGMVSVMSTLGVDQVIEGGQTMNPSTQDILAAIERVNAERVFVLPNNKNIILAVQQAQELSTGTTVHLIPSKTIPQGITALISYMPDMSPEENEANMREAITGVKTGQITYAVRDTVVDGHVIEEGDVLCMLESKIVHTADDIQSGAKHLLDMMMANGGDIISIYYGEDVKAEHADELAGYVTARWPECDLGMQYGAQPLYHYILSVE